jgi:hypothetical protein
MQQVGSLRLRLQPLVGRLCAVAGRLGAICSGSASGLRRRFAIVGRTLTVLRCAQSDFRVRDRAGVIHVARCQLPVAHRRRLVARQRHQVAGVRCRIAGSGRFEAALSGLFALLGAAIAKHTCEAMQLGIATLLESAIACSLIAVGSSLVVVARGLVAIRPRVITVREGLAAISERPNALKRIRDRCHALLLSRDAPVGGTHGRIT